MAGAKWLHVEVAYASESEQVIIPVTVASSVSIEEAIRASGILQRFPEINLARDAVGVFGQIAKLVDVVHDGERIEIYRKLKADPKAVRRLRAVHQRESKQRRR